MEPVKAIITGMLLLILLTACSNQAVETNTTPSDQPQVTPRQIEGVPTNTVMPNNPNGLWEYELKSGMLDFGVNRAIFTNRDLIGANFPASYEEMIEKGLIPIIFHNRYTGQPIKSIFEYSPGDIFYEADFEAGVYRFYRHQGEFDQNFDPEATDGRDLPWGGNPLTAQTDGKTIKVSDVLGLEPMNQPLPPDYFRESFGIPVDDEARARIFILYKWFEHEMYQVGDIISSVPTSLDGYIELVGERNPVAFTNPYTGAPMQEVEWYSVRMYNHWQPISEPIDELDGLGETCPPEAAGNYAFITAPSPVAPGENRAYALFYFREPDGSVSGYVSIGVGPVEKDMGALHLDYLPEDE